MTRRRFRVAATAAFTLNAYPGAGAPRTQEPISTRVSSTRESFNTPFERKELNRVYWQLKRPRRPVRDDEAARRGWGWGA